MQTSETVVVPSELERTLREWARAQVARSRAVAELRAAEAEAERSVEEERIAWVAVVAARTVRELP